MQYPITADGRYFVVRGRLWRTTNPELPQQTKERLIKELMAARRKVRAALQNGDQLELAQARHLVNETKIKLGERGPVWWKDGAPDLNRHLVKNTIYANTLSMSSDIAIM